MSDRVLVTDIHLTWNGLPAALHLESLEVTQTCLYSNLKTAIFNHGWTRSAPVRYLMYVISCTSSTAE